MSRIHSLLLAGALTCGCAAGTDELAQRLDATDTELRQEVEILQREFEAGFDREAAMATRLRRVEEDLAILQAEINTVGERLDSLGRQTRGAVAPGTAAGSGPADAVDLYRAAFDRHQDGDYEAALAGFERAFAADPDGSLADNARYWSGEAYYGQGRYRKALAAFTEVLAFESTEKADDAQIMTARSHLALGERDAALEALRRLLRLHPDSEYVDAARRELRYLEGQ